MDSIGLSTILVWVVEDGGDAVVEGRAVVGAVVGGATVEVASLTVCKIAPDDGGRTTLVELSS